MERHAALRRLAGERHELQAQQYNRSAEVRKYLKLAVNYVVGLCRIRNKTSAGKDHEVFALIRASKKDVKAGQLWHPEDA